MIAYGMDPLTFLFEAREKVRRIYLHYFPHLTRSTTQ